MVPNGPFCLFRDPFGLLCLQELNRSMVQKRVPCREKGIPRIPMIPFLGIPKDPQGSYHLPVPFLVFLGLAIEHKHEL